MAALRRGHVIGMLKPNLECENGHRSYAPNPAHWVTTKETLRFCIHEKCARSNVRVRRIGGTWQYESPYHIHPPKGVESEWGS